MKHRKRSLGSLGLPAKTHLEDAGYLRMKAKELYKDAKASAEAGACNNALYYLTSGVSYSGQAAYARKSATQPMESAMGETSAMDAFKTHCLLKH